MPKAKKSKEEIIVDNLIEEKDIDKLHIKDLEEKIINNENIGNLIKKTISLPEEIDLINNVFKNCFNEFKYEPYYKNIAFVGNVLVYFCNIKYDTIEDIIDFNNSGHFDEVLKFIDLDQIDNIKYSIDELIEFEKSKIIQILSNGNNEAINNINELIYKFHNIIDKVLRFTDVLNDKDIEESFNQIIPILKNMGDKFNQDQLVEKPLKLIKPKKETQKKPKNKKDNIINIKKDENN